jgi:acetyl esterase/lipase
MNFFPPDLPPRSLIRSFAAGLLWGASGVFGIIAALPQTVAVGAEPVVVKLWPEGAPEKPGIQIEPEKVIPPKGEKDVIRITNVSEPTVSIYPAPKPNGTAVLVCPGGGYGILAIEHEGTQVCEWLNSLGVTAVLLKYRVPVRQSVPGFEPLQDAQRAMGVLRKRAAEWGIDPQRIGILGFSAGGHLAVMTALHSNERMYRADPEWDGVDATPNFLIPIYPAYLVSKTDGFSLMPLCKPMEKAPPACFIHAHDDKGQTSSSGSALLYLEYKKLNIPAELHILSVGGHGFGMRKSGLPVNDWPQRVAEWMRVSGYLGRTTGP